MSHHDSHDSNAQGHAPGAHEKTDGNYSAGIWLIPVSLVIVLAFALTVYFLTASAATREIEAKRLEGVEAPRAQLLALRAHEDSLLNQYGLDTAGRARIPVDSAIKILAARAR
jgi:hypothetical protein